MSKNNDKVKQLKEKRAKINAKLDAQIRAILARHQAAERKKETRRKFLIGSIFLKKEAQGKWPLEESLKDMMDRHLTRDRDRKLFGLDARPKKGNGSPQENATAQPQLRPPPPQVQTTDEDDFFDFPFLR